MDYPTNAPPILKKVPQGYPLVASNAIVNQDMPLHTWYLLLPTNTSHRKMGQQGCELHVLQEGN